MVTKKRSIKKSVTKKHSMKKSVTKKRSMKKSVGKSVAKKRSTMKKSVSKKRSPFRIDTSKLDKCSLSKYGYSSKVKLVERREALKKAVKAYGHEKVWKKLNLVGILNKNRSPATSRVFVADKNWLKRTYF